MIEFTNKIKRCTDSKKCPKCGKYKKCPKCGECEWDIEYTGDDYFISYPVCKNCEYIPSVKGMM